MAEAAVHLWWADLTTFRGADADAVLDEVERRRRAAYRAAADRIRFVTGALMIRTVAAARLGIEPPEVAVDRMCRCGQPHGKPRVAGDLEFSVSHSGDAVVLAATTAGAVGVDVEIPGAVTVAELAPLVLADDEPCSTVPEFLRYWCRKEAVAKATGDGLTVPLAGIRVTGPGEPAALRSYPRTVGRLTLVDVVAPAGHWAALAVLGATAIRVVGHRADELLAGPVTVDWT